MKVEFVAPGAKPTSGAAGAFAAIAFEDELFFGAGAALDRASGGTLSRAAATAGFTGAK
jgi:hypothetical protein